MYMYTLGEYCIIIYYDSTEAQPYEGYANLKADCVCVCVCIPAVTAQRLQYDKN